MDLFKNNNVHSADNVLDLISVRLRMDYENSDNKVMKCDIHRSSDMSSYCDECRERICEKCELKHGKHNIINKNEVILSKLNSLSSLIEKFSCIKCDINDVMVQCDKQRTSIHNNQKVSEDNIDFIFEVLHKQLEEFKSNLLMELNQVVESCLERIVVSKLELTALQDDVSTITELVEDQKSAFENYDLFELEEYINQKLLHYTQTLPLDHLRPNQLNIQVKWTDNVKNIIKQPIAKINCHISPEKLSYLHTVSVHHATDKHKPFITSICCDKNNNIYLCDTNNKKIKVLNEEFVVERCFSGSGKYKLTSPTMIMTLNTHNQSGSKTASVIVCDSDSKNVTTFKLNGEGIDLFVTAGSNASMCSIQDLTEIEDLQDNSLELSQIYASSWNNDSQELFMDQNAIVICTVLENIHLEFLQINTATSKLYKSRPDLTLPVVDNTSFTCFKSVAWNHCSKFFFILDNHEHKVLIFSGQDGRFIRVYGRYGSGYGEFNEPSNILIDKEGLVLIADMVNNRIHVLDPLGNFIKFLFPYSHKHSISQPTAMCLDNDNHLIISERGGQIKIYTY